MILLQTKALTKSYERRGKRFSAADNINVCIEDGDFVCITGHSGSGKSTLLNMLTGLLKADSGEIIFNGECLCTLDDTELAHLRNSTIGYIPQGNSLLQNFSVLDNVSLPWYLTRKEDITGYARELLAKAGIAHLERESPRNLSGGEARRVAIARSLIANPKILIADEPTNDLDPASSDDVLRLFAEVNSKGVAVIIVTHEREIPPCVNRRFIMDNGRLTEIIEKSCHTPENGTMLNTSVCSITSCLL